MHLFSPSGQAVLPKRCFDALLQAGSQTIFLIQKRQDVNVRRELVKAGIMEDPHISESERVVELDSDNEGSTLSQPVNIRKRKRGPEQYYKERPKKLSAI